MLIKIICIELQLVNIMRHANSALKRVGAGKRILADKTAVPGEEPSNPSTFSNNNNCETPRDSEAPNKEEPAIEVTDIDNSTTE